jgi:hypothetical protein
MRWLSWSEVAHSEGKRVKERKSNRWKIYKNDLTSDRRKEPRNEGNMKNRRERGRKEGKGQERKKLNSVAFSPQANYTDRAIAACWRS